MDAIPAQPSRVSLACILGRLLDSLCDALNAVGTTLIGVLTVVVCADVFSRLLFNQPVKGVPELAAIMVVTIVYMQIASSLRAGRWTASDLLLAKCRGKAARIRDGLEVFYSACGCAMFLLIAWASLSYIRSAIESGDYVGVPGLFTFPTWPVKSIVAIGAFVTGLQFLRIGLTRLAAMAAERNAQ